MALYTNSLDLGSRSTGSLWTSEPPDTTTMGKKKDKKKKEGIDPRIWGLGRDPIEGHGSCRGCSAHFDLQIMTEWKGVHYCKGCLPKLLVKLEESLSDSTPEAKGAASEVINRSFALVPAYRRNRSAMIARKKQRLRTYVRWGGVASFLTTFFLVHPLVGFGVVGTAFVADRLIASLPG